MPNCESCGAGISASDKECPYCGASVMQTTAVLESELERPEKVYSTARDADGNTHIRFGDGQTGSRPPSGSDSISVTYRHGAGSQGNVPSGSLEEKLDQVTRILDRIPDPSKHKGLEDEGVVLLESISKIDDMLSLYQSSVSREAYLSSNDRERLSKKEDLIRPKLESMVTFCGKVDSKTQKKMGLTDSDIRKIKTTATKALQMTVSGKCSTCGAAIRSGTTRCQNCGAHL